MALAEEHIDAIHAAMESASGNVRVAVELINDLGWGWTERQLYGAINRNTALRIRWGNQDQLVSDPPPQSQTSLERPQHIRDAEAAAAAIEKQELGLRDTLTKLGRSEKEIELAIAARDLQTNYALQTLAMVGGSTAEIALWLKDDIAKIRAELSGTKPVLHDREKMLREDRAALAGAFIACSDRLTKAVVVQMEAKKRIAENKKKDQKKAQPRTLGITAQPGANVNVLMHK